MQLDIIQHKTKSDWMDPLMKYLAEHMDLIGQSDLSDVFSTMDEAFAFIQRRMVEFLEENQAYHKPAGLSLTYSRTSCCPATIQLSYLNQFITIKQSLNHETNPSKSNPKASGTHSQSNSTLTDSAQLG